MQQTEYEMPSGLGIYRTDDPEMKTLRVLNRSIPVLFLIGFLGQPLVTWLVNVFAPQIVRSSALGDLDPFSNLFFMLTCILPAVGGALVLTRIHVRSKLVIKKDSGDVMVGKYLGGFVLMLALFPIGFFWAVQVASILRP